MFLKGKVRVMPQKEGQDDQLEPNMRDPATYDCLWIWSKVR